MRCYLPSATVFPCPHIPVFHWDWLHLVLVLPACDVRLNKALLLSPLLLSVSMFWCWYSKGMQSWIPLQGWRQHRSYVSLAHLNDGKRKSSNIKKLKVSKGNDTIFIVECSSHDIQAFFLQETVKCDNVGMYVSVWPRSNQSRWSVRTWTQA